MNKLLTSIAAVGIALAATPATAAPQNDAGSGADAGNSFASPTPLPIRGRFDGRLDRDAGDTDDVYGFALDQGRAFSVLVSFTVPAVDPVQLLDPDGIVVDVGMRVGSFGVSASNALTAASAALSPSDEVASVRVTVHRPLVSGVYRLHLRAQRFAVTSYSMCVMNCDPDVEAPIELIFGGSLRHLDTRVLLVPPSHGDLGDPLGPTVLDYVNATLRGIHVWTRAIEAFATDHPQFSYLRDIDIQIEVFDGVDPVDPAGYDVVIGYVAAGPAFRGVATDTGTGFLEDWAEGLARYSGRYIALSLFGSSPRAGQVAYDFPEVNDLEIVTTHEFGHTFGLGHTRTWHPEFGPDIMNSPAPFVYGNGSPVGDGGERTAMKCLSSLNLYGLAELYAWAPSGSWEPSSDDRSLPDDMPYEWYC